MSWEIKEQPCFFYSFNVEFGVKCVVIQSRLTYSVSILIIMLPSGGFAKAINIFIEWKTPRKVEQGAPMSRFGVTVGFC